MAQFIRVMICAAFPFWTAEFSDEALAAPDVETSSRKYQARFHGGTGAWFLQQQQRQLLGLLVPWQHASILDVGGGHGQYTRALVDRGYRVTVLGSSPDANGQVQDLVSSGRCGYLVGDLTHLPIADRTFDVVTSFRLMAHLDEWQGFVAETSRIARRAVIVDVPVWRSFNALYPALFWVKRACERNSTRTFKVFREREVAAAFDTAGFQCTGRAPQYFFPMVVHRLLHAPSLSKAMERVCRQAGLTRRFGSPVILRFERGPPAFASPQQPPQVLAISAERAIPL